MRVLVTGGAGFIGSNFVRYVLNQTENDVLTVDALRIGGSRQNLDGLMDHPRHTFIEGDICDAELMTSLVGQTDVIVNFAGETHVDRAIEGAGSFVQTNVRGVQVLLEAAVETGIDRFIQISTDEVYGETIDGRFSENDRLSPRNPYAATKAGADLLALSYYTTSDLPVTIVRSSNNYGPRQHTEKLIPKFITRAAAGKPLPLYGDGSNVREWTYVTDNCRAIELVMRSGTPGEVYNVGSGQELSNRQVTEQILELVDASDDLIEFVPDRPGHDQRYALETSKIESLGWEPDWSFADGLERTVAHYTDKVSLQH